MRNLANGIGGEMAQDHRVYGMVKRMVVVYVAVGVDVVVGVVVVTHCWDVVDIGPASPQAVQFQSEGWVSKKPCFREMLSMWCCCGLERRRMCISVGGIQYWWMGNLRCHR